MLHNLTPPLSKLTLYRTLLSFTFLPPPTVQIFNGQTFAKKNKPK